MELLGFSRVAAVPIEPLVCNLSPLYLKAEFLI